MNLLRLLFVTFLGIFASNLSVSAKENKENVAQKVSTENALKQYVVTFHDEITAADFDDTSKWITDNRGEIVESINENFAKLIIAKMDPSILELSKLRPNLVESVEEDDLEWNDHVDL